MMDELRRTGAGKRRCVLEVETLVKLVAAAVLVKQVADSYGGAASEVALLDLDTAIPAGKTALTMMSRMPEEPDRSQLTDERCIRHLVYCVRCLSEKPPGVAPRAWSRLSVGTTKQGLQVWCERHQMSVLNIHFGGLAHCCTSERVAPSPNVPAAPGAN